VRRAQATLEQLEVDYQPRCGATRSTKFKTKRNKQLDTNEIRALDDSDLEKKIAELRAIPLNPDENGLWSKPAREAVLPLSQLRQEQERRTKEREKQKLNAELDKQIEEKRKEDARRAEIMREARRLGWTL